MCARACEGVGNACDVLCGRSCLLEGSRVYMSDQAHLLHAIPHCFIIGHTCCSPGKWSVLVVQGSAIAVGRVHGSCMIFGTRHGLHCCGQQTVLGGVMQKRRISSMQHMQQVSCPMLAGDACVGVAGCSVSVCRIASRQSLQANT